MPTLDDLSARLDAQVAGLTESTNLFKGRLPDTPDTCAAVFEYPGRESVDTFGTDHAIRLPRFQVQVRAASYAAAQSLIDLCHAALTFTNITISSTRYMRCKPLQDPFFLKRDGNERAVLVFNAEVWKG